MADQYGGSFKEYLELVKKPRLDKDMCQLKQSDWAASFQAWNVCYLLLNVLVAVLTFALGFLSKAAHFALIGIVHLAVSSAIGIAIGFFLCHMGWYCVVKQKGCCGNIGYLLWGLAYFLFVFWPLVRGAMGLNLLSLVMAVPAGFMILALYHLFKDKPTHNLLAT
mmetsp:Transcript_92185/g.269740  ORF Transcript_92185/g.269740 Transcript_92185/m.269740 type:complete len:165 (+) Transcript_92185:72-566(+)